MKSYKRRSKGLLIMDKIQLLDEPLIRSLLDETISFYEVMNAYNIQTQVAFVLPPSVYGFVFLSKNSNYYIILNGNINYETQVRTFVHEVKHIVEDCPKHNYIIGIDMQHTELEDDSDLQRIFNL